MNAWQLSLLEMPVYFTPPDGSAGRRLFKGGGSAPPPPDYGAAAKEQGAANIETARVQGRMNNPNIISPLGNQTVTWGSPATPDGFDQSGFDAAMAAYNTGQGRGPETGEGQWVVRNTPGGNSETEWVSSGGGKVPQRSDFIIPGSPGDGDQPTINQTLTPQGQARFDQEQRIIGQLGGVAERGLGRVDDAMSRPFDTSGLPQAITSLNTSGLSRLPGTDDFSADRQRVEEAIMSRLNPQFQRDEESLRTRLLNQGVSVGTEAANRELDVFNRAKTDARMQAILSGGQEQSRLFGLGMQSRQQGVNELLNNAELANRGRQTGIQEQAYLRSLPLNELNALRSGSQVTMPQFQSYQGSGIQPPNLMQAAQLQGQAGMNQYNAGVASDNSTMQGLSTVASAALPFLFALSDRRLKSDIVRLGTHRLGIGIYEYEIFGRREVGVMADEVMKVRPHAVARHESGYWMVNYGALA